MLITAVRLYCNVRALTPVTTGENSAPPQASNCAAKTKAVMDLRVRDNKRVDMGAVGKKPAVEAAYFNADFRGQLAIAGKTVVGS
jgi:hypothetical protein